MTLLGDLKEPIEASQERASLSNFAAASFDEAWISNPSVAMYRQKYLENAYELSSEHVPAENARARLKEEGLTGRLQIPDDGIGNFALDTLIERKKAEIKRQEIFAKVPSGSTATALTVGIAASLLDPLSVASAFVPIVPEARYTALIAKLGWKGRIVARGGVGAIEGAAGAALVEPFIYSSRQSEQADYEMADSLRNIAFGGVFGAGLHTSIGGAVDIVKSLRGGADDIVSRLDPETRNAALKTGVAQAASGESINIDPIVKADPAHAEPVSARGTVESLDLERRVNRMLDLEETRLRGLSEGPDATAVRTAAENPTELAVKLADYRKYLDEKAAMLAEPQAAQIDHLTEANMAKQDYVRALRERYNTTHVEEFARKEATDIVKAERAKTAEQMDNVRKVVGNIEKRAERITAVQAAEVDLQTLQYGRRSAKTLADLIHALPKESRAAMLKKLESIKDDPHRLATDEDIASEAPKHSTEFSREAVANAKVEAEKPKVSMLSDPKASEDADVRLKEPVETTTEDAQAELTEQQGLLDESLKSLGLEPRDLSEFDDLIKDANTYAKVAKAAVVCGLRHA